MVRVPLMMTPAKEVQVGGSQVIIMKPQLDLDLLHPDYVSTAVQPPDLLAPTQVSNLIVIPLAASITTYS